MLLAEYRVFGKSKARLIMAIFHLEAAVISRGKGQSAVVTAAYNAREKIKCEHDNTTKNYAYKGGVIDKGITLPAGAADWMGNRAMLWNGVERKENESKRWETAQLARRFIYAVPTELKITEQIALVKNIAECFAQRGMVADWVLHEPDKKGDKRNVHAHIMTSLRSINEHGEFGNKNREWNDKEYLKALRKEICEITNKYLKKYNVKVDHRTLEEQGIKREAGKHKGVKITAMERRYNNLYEEWKSLDKELKSTAVESENQKQAVQQTEILKPRTVEINKKSDIINTEKEKEMKQKRPEPPKTKEELFVACCISVRPYIVKHIMAEMEDLQKRGENVKNGGFDEYYKQDKKIVDDTRKLFNEARESNNYEKWNKVFHSLYFDPASYPKEYKLNNFKYSNARYTIWEKIRQPFMKIEKELFPPKQNIKQSKTQEQGGFTR